MSKLKFQQELEMREWRKTFDRKSLNEKHENNKSKEKSYQSRPLSNRQVMFSC